MLNRYKDEDKILASKVKEYVLKAQKESAVRFTKFLNLSEASLCKEVLALLKWNNFSFWGGYDDAERTVLAVYGVEIPVENVDFSIEIIKITSKKIGGISHKDVLGALMGLGIKREIVGDIIVLSDSILIFVLNSFSEFILQNLKMVSSYSVTCELQKSASFHFERKYEEKSDTVASLRLDSVVSSMINVSRSVAKELIEAQRIFIDGKICDKATKIISENDIISVRGFGKFEIADTQNISRKGRIVLKYKKYL